MANSQDTFQTADLMKMFGIGRNTLRLYEEVGLLTGMARTEAGYREYNESHREVLAFILKAKEAGFTLNEIKNLLSTLKGENKLTCGTVAQEITVKVDDIEKEIETLHTKKNFLQKFLKTCSANNEANNCDIITAGFVEKACCS